MKGLYSELIDNQDFGFKDEYHIQKAKSKFDDYSKLITENIKAYVYRINFSYKTKRSNRKQSCRHVVLKDLDKDEAKVNFIEYINNFNKKFPYRELSNVEILDIQCEEIIIPL